MIRLVRTQCTLRRRETTTEIGCAATLSAGERRWSSDHGLLSERRRLDSWVAIRSGNLVRPILILRLRIDRDHLLVGGIDR